MSLVFLLELLSINGTLKLRRRGRHAESDSSETPMADLGKAAGDVMKSGRKSLNKAIEKVVDAASIPLPETPVNMCVLLPYDRSPA